MKKCEWHLCENEAKQKFCSVKCKNKAAVDRFRKNLKRKSVEYMGGSCVICGYDKHVGALQFHHLDPDKKDFGISESGNTRTWNVIKEELDKCVMLCANCHTEVHAGITAIP
jgi:5-methylcytosine-specific restriction endonuclease McrA